MMTSDSMCKCDRCGGAFAENGGARELTRLCPACRSIGSHVDNSEKGLGSAAVFIVVGCYVLALSLLADWLRFGSDSGFGWQQLAGVFLGGVLVVTGGITRVAAILVIGLLILCVTLLADWLAFGDSEGFGWQQGVGCAVGLILILVGIMCSRTRSCLVSGERDSR